MFDEYAVNLPQSLGHYHHQLPNTHYQQCDYNIQHYHQQQQQLELHPHQFMADTHLSPDEEEQGDVASKAAHRRRAKRTIPDREKDAKYWDKRMRNNIAAKRSRENKRTLEHDIRYKVSVLQEENALLRKEISSIKNRFGLPMEMSILTPEEREQCMLEIKHSPKMTEAKRKRDSSAEVVSSTSQNVLQASLQRTTNETVETGRGSSDNSNNSSPRVKEESPRTQPAYGLATYGPFQPSPSWTPVPPVGFPPFYGDFPAQNFPSSSGQSKLSPGGNLATERSSTPYSCYFNKDNYFVNRGMGSFIPPPYSYYMPYANQGGSALYGNYNDEANTDVTPADLSMNRNKVKREIREVSAETGSGSGVVMAMNNKISDVSSSIAKFLPTSSTSQSLSVCDVSVKDSSSGQAQIRQNQFCTGRKLLTQLSAPLRDASGQSTMTSSGGSDFRFKSPGLENLRRKYVTPKMTVQSLSAAQAELMKDQSYTN